MCLTPPAYSIVGKQSLSPVVWLRSAAGLESSPYYCSRGSDSCTSREELRYATSVASVQAAGDRLVFVGASATTEPAVVSVRVEGTAVAGEPELLRAPRDLGIDTAWFSTPQAISFPTTGSRIAHALFYPPTNPEAAAPEAADRAGTAQGAVYGDDGLVLLPH